MSMSSSSMQTTSNTSHHLTSMIVSCVHWFTPPDSFVPFCVAPLSCLLEACLHLMKNVIWWACLTQVGNKLNKVSFLFCIAVILLAVGVLPPSWRCTTGACVSWLKVNGCKLNIHAAEWPAAIAQTVFSTLINHVLFSTCNGTQRPDSSYYWHLGRYEVYTGVTPHWRRRHSFLRRLLINLCFADIDFTS